MTTVTDEATDTGGGSTGYRGNTYGLQPLQDSGLTVETP